MYLRTLDNGSDNRGAKRFHFFMSSQRSHRFQNRFFKQFLVIFGFATSSILLFQLYLSLYYDDPMNTSMINIFGLSNDFSMFELTVFFRYRNTRLG